MHILIQHLKTKTANLSCKMLLTNKTSLMSGYTLIVCAGLLNWCKTYFNNEKWTDDHRIMSLTYLFILVSQSSWMCFYFAEIKSLLLCSKNIHVGLTVVCKLLLDEGD